MDCLHFVGFPVFNLFESRTGFSYHKAFSFIASTDYQNVLTSLQLPLPSILYPFANSKEYLLKDYGPNQLHLLSGNVDLRSAHHIRFGFPHHAIDTVQHAGTDHAYLKNSDISAAQITSAFTFLLHFQLENDNGKLIQLGETDLKFRIDIISKKIQVE